MKISNKLLIGYAAVFLTIIIEIILIFIVIKRTDWNEERVEYAYTQLSALEEINGFVNRQLKELSDLILLGDDELYEYRDYKTRTIQAIKKYTEITKQEIAYVEEEEEEQVVRDLETKYLEIVEYSQLVISAISVGNIDTAIGILENEIEEKYDEEFISLLENQIEDERIEIQRTLLAIKRFKNKIKNVAVLAILFTIVATVFVTVLVFKRIALPIKNLSSISQEIGRGKLDTEINISSNDEIGTLAKNLGQMVKDLKIYIEKEKELAVSKAKQEELEKSLYVLEKSFAEKEYLMKELNHRVKNNLAMISALVNLKNSSLGESGLNLPPIPA